MSIRISCCNRFCSRRPVGDAVDAPKLQAFCRYRLPQPSCFRRFAQRSGYSQQLQTIDRDYLTGIGPIIRFLHQPCAYGIVADIVPFL